MRSAADNIARRLGEYGYQVAWQILDGHIDSGETIGNLRVEQVGTHQFRLVTDSQAILFFEFGTGLGGYGHPNPLEYGPGTWSTGPQGKGHWDDPNGWYYYKNGRRYHTYGQPPHMPFYQADQEMIRRFVEIAREEMRGIV